MLTFIKRTIYQIVLFWVYPTLSSFNYPQWSRNCYLRTRGSNKKYWFSFKVGIAKAMFLEFYFALHNSEFRESFVVFCLVVLTSAKEIKEINISRGKLRLYWLSFVNFECWARSHYLTLPCLDFILPVTGARIAKLQEIGTYRDLHFANHKRY